MSVATFRKATLHRAFGEKRRDFVQVTFVLKAGLECIQVVVTSDRNDGATVTWGGRAYTVKTNQQPNVMHWTYPWFLNLTSNAPADVAKVDKPRDACSFAMARFAENIANAVLKNGEARS